MRGRAIAALALAAAVGLSQPAYAVDPTFTASASPESITSLTKRIVYRLQMTTGVEPEHFFITPRRPAWRAGGVGSPVWFAFRARERDYVWMEGPGVIRSGAELNGTLPGPLCLRGFDHPFHPLIWLDVVLPPSSTSTLVIDADAGLVLPFLDTDQRVRFEIGQVPGPPTKEAQGTLDGPVTLSAGPAYHGSVAPLITLAYRHLTEAPGERRIRIRGSTEPALKNAGIELRATGRRPTRLRTNRQGRFILRRFRIPRSYTEVTARYAGGHPAVAAGDSCPLRFGTPPRG